MKRNLWSVLAFVIAILLMGCESSDNGATIPVKAVNLDQPLRLSVKGRPYTIEPAQTSLKISSKSREISLSDVKILSQPEAQACFVDVDSSSEEQANTVRIRCEDVRRWFDDATDFALTDGSLCVANGSEVRCWGYLNGVRFRDLLPLDDDDSGSQYATFENPRLLTMVSQSLCFLDGDELRCSVYSGVDNEAVSAQMQNVTEMALFQDGVLCYIDDNGLNCVGDETKTLVANAPTDLSNPTGLVSHDNKACVISEGQPYCWGGIWSDVPVGLTDVTSFTFNEYYFACATVLLGVECWQPPSFDVSTDWYPQLTSAPDLLAFNNVSLCTADLDGVKCWGDYQVGNAAAEVVLRNPDKLVFNDLGGCAIEDRSLICFGDPIAPQFEYLEE